MDITSALKKYGSVGISIINSIARLMQHDSEICEQIMAASDRWEEGSLHNTQAAVFGDITDGGNFRRHKITWKAGESEVDTVRIGLQLYNDGVTIRAHTRLQCQPREPNGSSLTHSSYLLAGTALHR